MSYAGAARERTWSCAARSGLENGIIVQALIVHFVWETADMRSGEATGRLVEGWLGPCWSWLVTSLSAKGIVGGGGKRREFSTSVGKIEHLFWRCGLGGRVGEHVLRAYLESSNEIGRL